MHSLRGGLTLRFRLSTTVFVSLLLLLMFLPVSAFADIVVRDLVTDGQGILPNSGSVEVLAIDTEPTVRLIPGRPDGAGVPDTGFISPISLTYTVTAGDDIWLIEYVGTETSLTGNPGTIRFGVARSLISDHPSYPDLEDLPLADNELSAIWQRQINEAYQPDPSLPRYSPWRYLDARVGPNVGPGEPYTWSFTGASGGLIALTINLCDPDGFGGGSSFHINTGNLYTQMLTEVTFRVRNVGDDTEVTPDDFTSFSIYADSPFNPPGRKGVFDPLLDSLVASVPSTVAVLGPGGFDITLPDLTLSSTNTYFVTVETSDTIDSHAVACLEADDFTIAVARNSIEFDGGDYTVPLSCEDFPIETGAIVCESLVIDTLPLTQDYYDQPVQFPGQYPELLNGRQRYKYFIPDLTIRLRYAAEYELLSGVTEDSFDFLFKDLDDPLDFFRIPEVTPLERRFDVLGLDVAGGTADNPEHLLSTMLTFTNTFLDSEFDPREHLDEIRDGFPPYPEFSGVWLYKDTNDNGAWDEAALTEDFQPIPGTGDLPLGMAVYFDFEPLDPEATEFDITLAFLSPDWVNPEAIDLLADGQPDYFLVLRNDSGVQDESLFFRDGKGINLGANFYTWLDSSSVDFERALPDFGLMSSTFKESYSALQGQDYSMYFGPDINPGGVPIVQMIDAESPPTPILAFNATCTDVPQTGYVADPIRFESIKMQFDGTDTGFDPADIEDIIIYRDDKSPYFDFPDRNIGAYDFMNDMANMMAPGASFDSLTNPAEESPIPVNAFEILDDPDNPGDFVVTLAPQQIMQFYPRDKIETSASIDNVADNFIQNDVNLPENIMFSGSDYFVCIETSTDIAYRDIIRATIPIGGVVASTGPTVLKTEDMMDPEELVGEETVRELTANVPVILEGLVPLNDTLGANEENVSIIGINTFTNSPFNGEEVFLEQLVVQFIEAASRLTPNLDLGDNGDLLAYQDVNGDDTPLSGIKVWRRIGEQSYLVKFAETDHNPYTFLDNPSLVASSDASHQAVLMVFNKDDLTSLYPGEPSVQDLLRIPETDDDVYEGNDFIITISTSEHFDMRQDNFSVAIISWGPDSPGAPQPYRVLNGDTPGYPPIPPAFQFASSSALKFYQKFDGTTRGIGFVDDLDVHSRSFKSINTNPYNAAPATRLEAVGNFAATLDDPSVTDKTRQAVLTWEDTNFNDLGRFNESGHWIESDMFGTYRPLAQAPLPRDTESLFFSGPRFLAGRTVNFRIYPFQENLNPSTKVPPMNGAGPIAETSITFDLSINPVPPTADFSGTPLSGCAPLTVNFTDQSLDNPETWLWDFGDGYTSPQPNPTHTYQDSGTYTVSLEVCNVGGCSTKTEVDYVTVRDIPVADFVADELQICAGETVQFTDLSTGYPAEWSWVFGDGGTSDEENPEHMYSTPGTYPVTLTVTNDCGTDDEIKLSYITVTEGLVAEFSGEPTLGCVPLNVQFTDESLCGPETWLWDFGDGETSTEQNPLHVYVNPGQYTVTLTVTKTGEPDDIETKENYVTVTRVLADFSGGPAEICSGETVEFTDESLCDPDTWLWEFGDGATSTEQNPVHEYAAPGTYEVCLTVTKDIYSDMHCESDYVTVNASPEAAFEATIDPVCTLYQVDFTDNSTGNPTSWLWEFGDGTTSTEQSPLHTYPAEDQYLVCLTVENDCGTDSLCEMVEVRCPEISLSPVQLSPETECYINADDDTFEVWNSAGGILAYTVSDNVDWLSCSPPDGTSTGEHDTITVNYTTSGLDAGYHSATITVGDPSASNSPQTVNVSLTVAPVLTIVAVPEDGGSVSGGGTYDLGDVIQISATPNACWVFDHWEGDVSGTANPTQVTMDACMNVEAHFVPLTYTMTTIAEPFGAGWVDGGGPQNCGDTATVEAHGYPYWVFDHWSGDLSGSENPAQILMDGNKTVTAHFVSSLSWIGLIYPFDGATIYEPPVFTWNGNAGSNNVFRVVLWSSGRLLYSPIVSNQTWTMPTAWWNQIPADTYVYWLVQGADQDHEPLTIVTSEEIRWFYKRW